MKEYKVVLIGNVINDIDLQELLNTYSNYGWKFNSIVSSAESVVDGGGFFSTTIKQVSKYFAIFEK